MNEDSSQYVFFILTGTLVLFLLVFFIVLFFVFYNKRQQRNTKEKQLLQSQFSEALLKTQIEIQEQTLHTVSQEIHDNIGQVLTLAKLHLGTYDATETESNELKISDTKQLISKAINDLRDLSKSMSGDKIADIGLLHSIENEIKIINNTGKFKAVLTVNGEATRLSNQSEMVVFRIVQESLNNSLKHSKAHNINVTMNFTSNKLLLIVADDGLGFNADKLNAVKTGIGLSNMKSRAALIGANFSLTSKPHEGTITTIEITI